MNDLFKYTTRKRISPEKIIAWTNFHFKVKPRRNGELTINNPLVYDTGYNFNIDPTSGMCHDWRGDEWAGPITKTGKRNTSFVNFVSKYLQCTLNEAIASIGGADSTEIIKRVDERPKSAIKLPSGFKPAKDTIEYAETQHNIKYLKSRGYTDEMIERDEIHMRGYDILWPYYEFGEIVYWQYRNALNKRFMFPTDIVDENGNDIGKGDYVYGFDDCKPKGPLIVVESIFNKITLGDQCIAVGGAVIQERQLDKIRFLQPSKVILALDNDKAGLLNLVKNFEAMSPYGMNVYSAIPTKAGDWNDYITKLRMHRNDILKEFYSSIEPITKSVAIKIKLKYSSK